MLSPLMLSTLHQRRVPTPLNRQCYFGATWKAPAPSTMGASAQWSPGQRGAGKCMEPRLTKSSSVSWSPGLKRVTDLDRQVHTPLAKSSSVPWSPGLKQVTDLDRPCLSSGLASHSGGLPVPKAAAPSKAVTRQREAQLGIIFGLMDKNGEGALSVCACPGARARARSARHTRPDRCTCELAQCLCSAQKSSMPSERATDSKMRSV